MPADSPHLAPWRSPLARCLYQHRSQPQSRYLQLATTDLTGRPTNRTVVFRGFIDHLPGHHNLLKFVSDSRSQKIQHLDHQPWAEACWYFPNTREQYRIAGKIMVISGNTNLEQNHQTDSSWQRLRLNAWNDLSENARSQFSWLDPGLPLQSTDSNNPPAELVESLNPKSVQPIDNFCLLLLDPELVDRLELRNDPQVRSQYQKNMHNSAEQWITQSLNP